MEGFLTGLNARRKPDDILNLFLQAPVEIDQEIDRSGLLPWNVLQETFQLRPRWLNVQIRPQFLSKCRIIGKRASLRSRLQEEIKRIQDIQFGNQINLDEQFLCFVREYQSCQIVALGILLPVDEMLMGSDLQRIAENRSPAVWSWAQSHDLGASSPMTMA